MAVSRTLVSLCGVLAAYNAMAADLGDGEKRMIRKISMDVSANGEVTPHSASLYEDMEVNTRVSSLVEEVEQMARAGSTPEPEKIKIIKNIVNNELIPDLKATRQSSVNQIAVNLAAIKTCNKNGVETQQNIAGSTEVAVGSARSTHTACRTEEKNKKSHKEGRCKELDDFLNDVAVPQSMPSPKVRDQMVPYVQKMSNYFCPKGPKVTSLDKACKTAEKEHAEHKASCDKNQAAFEMAFCQWRTQITDTCTTLDQCYKGALAIHNKFVAATKILEKKWKVEYSSLKKIVCYTDVWLTDSKVSSENLQKCQSTTVDTSPMDITYPAVPEQAQCVTTKVDIYPGSTAFATTEYKDFLDFAVSVIPCTGEGKPPPRPTVGPTSKPEVPFGSGFDGNHITKWGLSTQYFKQTPKLCGVEYNKEEDDKRKNGGGDWKTYFKSGYKNAGCGGACNNDNGVNIECHFMGKSKNSGLRGVNAYAKTNLISDSDKKVTLMLGSDDGIIVWVNGEQVFENLHNCRCYSDNQFSKEISLKKGDNTVVIKIGENDGHFGFIAAVKEGSNGLASSDLNL